MRRIVVVVMLGAFLLASPFGLEAIQNGRQPLVLGTIPLTDPVLLVGPPTVDAHGRPIFY